MVTSGLLGGYEWLLLDVGMVVLGRLLPVVGRWWLVDVSGDL